MHLHFICGCCRKILHMVITEKNNNASVCPQMHLTCGAQRFVHLHGELSCHVTCAPRKKTASTGIRAIATLLLHALFCELRRRMNTRHPTPTSASRVRHLLHHHHHIIIILDCYLQADTRQPGTSNCIGAGNNCRGKRAKAGPGSKEGKMGGNGARLTGQSHSSSQGVHGALLMQMNAPHAPHAF